MKTTETETGTGTGIATATIDIETTGGGIRIEMVPVMRGEITGDAPVHATDAHQLHHALSR